MTRTETVRNRQKQSETDRNSQKQTETDRNTILCLVRMLFKRQTTNNPQDTEGQN